MARETQGSFRVTAGVVMSPVSLLPGCPSIPIPISTQQEQGTSLRNILSGSSEQPLPRTENNSLWKQRWKLVLQDSSVINSECLAPKRSPEQGWDSGQAHLLGQSLSSPTLDRARAGSLRASQGLSRAPDYLVAAKPHPVFVCLFIRQVLR